MCFDVWMPKQSGKLVLNSAEKEKLQQLIRAQRTPQGVAQRARVVELAAQGLGVRAIGERVGMHFNRAAKAALARSSCARSSIKPRGHRRAGRDGLAARWLASWESPRRPCSGSGVRTKLSPT